MRVKQIITARSSSYFLTVDKKVWACGSNRYGQLGNGQSGIGVVETRPVQITIPGKTIVKVVAGFYHTFFICSDGTFWACGSNYSGQLGNGQSGRGVVETRPVQITTIPGNIVKVVAGFNNTFFICSDGTFWACGYNFHGQLGNGQSGRGAMETRPVQITIPGKNIVNVVVGSEYTFFMCSDETVWACGSNSCGQLGNGQSGYGAMETRPVQITTIPGNIGKVVAGFNNTFFICSDGTAWVCGDNQSSQLGNGQRGEWETRPVQITIPGKTIVKVVAGSNHTFFIYSDGTFWACGNNSFGQLGNGKSGYGAMETRPVQIPIPGENIVKVVAGSHHTFFLFRDGTAWACGNNQQGQFGNGQSGDRAVEATPVLLKNIRYEHKVVDVYEEERLQCLMAEHHVGAVNSLRMTTTDVNLPFFWRKS